jgi:SRSO17 transposase
MPMNVLSGGNPMTEKEISALGPTFSSYLGQFRGCFARSESAGHFDTYCRGLLSDLPRKSVEPIALKAGTTVRTLQEFLANSRWNHAEARHLLQQHLAGIVNNLPADELGTIGVVDETSCQKWGDQTPGVQRQYLGCVGKIDNGIVTVHIGVAHGNFQALLDADLYLPESWAADRQRCRDADIPDSVGYRSKWQLALDQYIRLHESGIHFDWMVFDEYYGSKVPFLWTLGLLEQKFVAEVPVNFTVRSSARSKSCRADHSQPANATTSWQRFRLARKTVADQFWRATSKRVWVADGWHLLITAESEKTGEVKFFVSNVVNETLEQLLRVAFRRATIEHAFRLAKQEAGLMHFEGRSYTGLMRHLILALIVLGFVAVHTQRLRGKKSRGDGRASVSGFEPTLRDIIPPSARCFGTASYQRSNPVSPGQEQASHDFTQETAALELET